MESQINDDFVAMAGELREILGSIIGAKKVEEGVILQYMVHVDSDNDKENVEKVALELIKQAEKNHLALEITAVTQADIEDAKKRLASLMEEN